MFKNSSSPHEIEIFPWPACSPDISPIDNVWSTLPQRLSRDTPHAATPDQLWQYVEAAWTAVAQGYIQSFFVSMLSHVAAVIAKDGGYTYY
ncbi:transposable element Tcb1 transposase [Trichonephila clavipes]|uniref:Transposable element Tcb1 transposase n=1 Tax=Trichonephila clavipes TaxID=2585209 RepID=A0A8X6WFQ5_TRICX|nr:transposable element Tcb1 transposase [Trichonephila clavipes]